MKKDPSRKKFELKAFEVVDWSASATVNLSELSGITHVLWWREGTHRAFQMNIVDGHFRRIWQFEHGR